MEEKPKIFPFDVKILESQKLADYLRVDEKEHFLHIGPKNYLFPDLYLSDATNIYNFPLKSDDTFIVTFPKSGTTLTQELLWLICNNLDYEKAESTVISKRFPYLEYTSMMREIRLSSLTSDQLKSFKETILTMTVNEVGKIPSPRFIKSHLPLSLLPPTLLDKTKVVYVARNPKDVAVSYYHHHKLLKMVSSDCEFKTFWKHFISEDSTMVYGPFLDHVIEAWEMRKHLNMLFLFYEDIVKDVPAAVRMLADFFGKTLSEEQVCKLAEHVQIDKFRKNMSVNLKQLQQSGVMTKDGDFIRKGKSGGWREYFDEEMTAQADEWVARHLQDTDLKFPDC